MRMIFSSVNAFLAENKYVGFMQVFSVYYSAYQVFNAKISQIYIFYINKCRKKDMDAFFLFRLSQRMRQKSVSMWSMYELNCEDLFVFKAVVSKRL